MKKRKKNRRDIFVECKDFSLLFFFHILLFLFQKIGERKGEQMQDCHHFSLIFSNISPLAKPPGFMRDLPFYCLLYFRIHRKNLRQIIPYYPVFSLAFGQENLSLLSFLFLLCYLNFEDTIHEPNNSCTRVLLFLFIPFLFLFSLYLKGRNQEGKVLSERTLRRCKQ